MIIILDIVLLVAMLLIIFWPRITLKRSGAKLLENRDFLEKSLKGQIVDVREPAQFRTKHIMGARNLPAETISQSMGALSKSKPVLLYENGQARGQNSRVIKVARLLKKEGYTEIFILKSGLSKWVGKTKTN
ncbi:MAG: rhodanese-like domain-containing protein [Streptococcaceae bacterium]|jgi:rhodanese-related sulfurtransferase|nr:rhodanese-like domain-containing protein [Streptococcaceae bacterium]